MYLRCVEISLCCNLKQGVSCVFKKKLKNYFYSFAHFYRYCQCKSELFEFLAFYTVLNCYYFLFIEDAQKETGGI